MRSRSNLALPYSWRLSVLMRLMVPSTAPELEGRVSPLIIAAWSRMSPVAKKRRWGGRQPRPWRSRRPDDRRAGRPQLGDPGDVAGEGVHGRAAVQRLLSRELLVGVRLSGWRSSQPVMSRTLGGVAWRVCDGGLTEGRR